MFALILSAGLAIIISAMCSIMEAALYSVSVSHVEYLRSMGRTSGRILQNLRSDIEKPISAILIVNTVANTAGASIAGAAAVNYFGDAYTGIFAAVFTLAILILSEILPKTVGVAYAKQIAPFMALPLKYLVLSLLPIIWVTGAITRLVRKPSASQTATTENDIMAIVSLTRKAGILKAFEESTIRNILSLDTKVVADIMTPRTVVFSLPAHISAVEARGTAKFWNHSRIPVYENDDPEEVVGIVYRRSVLNALANQQDEITLDKLMRPVRFVLGTLTLDKLLLRFLESRLHLFVVLDEYGGVDGVVTLEDVLEEMLGKEIVDETDQVEDLRELARLQRQQLTTEAASLADAAQEQTGPESPDGNARDKG
ncbi:hemolysin family protein [Oceanidesulfovibrio marinus]|uniref:HlyC/CorC family transporter n=1 Tax=Oceanidesulfovibrio marinus TaxID=370038 RepID=A0ABX6NCX0_9BACT|nr:hemolysin family protein [Oceanidesulfovibrio marinus]QJT08448.1 HlyC/CorC family transporter [Oceanidesulfovibrio marinus]